MAIFDPCALLERLRSEPHEAEWVEFKVSQGDPEVIGPTISALANGAMLADRDRGFLVFGVKDDTREKVGTTVRLKKMKIGGGTNFELWISTLLKPKLNLELLDFELDSLRFSIICVEATYDCPVKFRDVEYIRIGENTKKLSEFPNKARALWLATGRRKFEHAIALGNQTASMTMELLDTKAYYNLANQPHPQNAHDVVTRFVRNGLLVDNMQGTYDITNLAALLLARDISSFPSITHKSVRVIRYKGDDKQDSETEQEGRRGYAVGFPGIIKFILDRIPKQEVYVEGVRRTQHLYPEVAIREIVANALIHQDFTVTGASPVIEIYDNRLEVTNPGNSLIPIDRILDDRRSRNEKLAATMRDLGLCEERGGGLDKAIMNIELRKLPAPDFIPSENSFRVVMFGPKLFSEMSKLDKRRACFYHCILRYLKQDFMSNATLRQRFSLRDEEYQLVSAVISDSLKEGRIAPADPKQGNKYARYIPYFAVAGWNNAR